MNDTAPAGRRKIQFRLSTLILATTVCGLGIGLFFSSSENRQQQERIALLREENARLKSKGGEQVFFAFGGMQLTYHLSGSEAETFLAMLNSSTAATKGDRGDAPMGFFYVGNNVYPWYGGSVTGCDKDGNPTVWTGACLSRMVKYCADRKYSLSSDELGEMFRAFRGEKTESPGSLEVGSALSNEENATPSKGGTVQIFFEDGFKYTYRLKPEARDKVLAILNTPPVYRKAPANRRAWARFFVGNDEYEIEGNEIFSEDEDGNQKVWSDDGFRRMMRFAADSRIGPSSYDEYEKLFEAFMGKDLSAPKPPDAPKP